MLKKIEKMQIITVLQDMKQEELDGNALLETVEPDNFTIAMHSAKSQLGIYGLSQAEEKYQARYGADDGLKYLQSLKA